MSKPERKAFEAVAAECRILASATDSHEQNAWECAAVYLEDLIERESEPDDQIEPDDDDSDIPF